MLENNGIDLDALMPWANMQGGLDPALDPSASLAGKIDMTIQESTSISTDQPAMLNEFEIGQRVKVQKVNGDRELARRLLGLGLRNGVELEIVQIRGNGVVVARGETRIALGSGVVDKLLVVPL